MFTCTMFPLTLSTRLFYCEVKVFGVVKIHKDQHLETSADTKLCMCLCLKGMSTDYQY